MIHIFSKQYQLIHSCAHRRYLETLTHIQTVYYHRLKHMCIVSVLDLSCIGKLDAVYILTDYLSIIISLSPSFTILLRFGHAPLNRLGDSHGDVVIVGGDLPEMMLLPNGEEALTSISC